MKVYKKYKSNTSTNDKKKKKQVSIYSANANANANMSDSKKKKKTISIYSGDGNSKKKKKTISIYSGDGDSKKKKKTISIYSDSKKKKKQVSMYSNGSNGKKKYQNTNLLLSGSLSGSYDDKKKKKVVNIDIEKQKKIIENITGTKWDNMDKNDVNNVGLDSMKKTLCNLRYGNFLDVDVSDRTPYWGLGVEHEMQLFHKARSGMQNTNIMFDSQESTCFLINDEESCTKSRKEMFGKIDDFTEDVKKYVGKDGESGDFGLTHEEKQYLSNIQWELSGRQIKSCDEPEKQTHILKRTPILMPELITTNFSNRSIDSIAQEIIDLEKHYIDIHMKNPHTKQKVALYGPLTTHLCGANSEILVPKHPKLISKEYHFKKEKMTDYVGSYHITITLPHTRDINTKDFVKMHQNMAQQIQWLEPLLTTAFFSPTQAAVGNSNETEGSFRIMTVGWGNFGGSDVRKMGSIGLDRGSNLKATWRSGLNFTGTKKLNYCAKKAPVQYKKSKTVHTGDFRTFGVENNMEKCVKLYNPSDCQNGRADGAPMKPPFGVEIRIFDHFPAEYLIELMRIVVLIASNAQRHPAKEYVYTDKRWKHAIHAIMKDGWNAIVDPTYINALRTNLGLPIHTSSVLAYDILKQIVKELFEINKDAYINKLMNEHPDIEPVVPSINRMCWEMAFTQKYNTKVVNFLKRTFHNEQKVSLVEFGKMMKNDSEMDYDKWKNDINDLLYALETHHHVQLDIFNGKIKGITIML